MLALPVRNVDGTVQWPQFDFVPLTAPSGTLPSGSVVVRAKTAIHAETVFPCLGKVVVGGSFSPRFHPAVMSPAETDFVVDGCPSHEPHHVPLTCVSGGAAGHDRTVAVGTRGWSFFPYCREPPPSMTLSTAAIASSFPSTWADEDMNESLKSFLTAEESEVFIGKPVPIIVSKRFIDAGEEMLVVFNQFDGVGRIWQYPSPSPFVRIPSTVHLLTIASSLDCVRAVLGGQESQSITDSYVKLLEDTAGMDSRTTERINVAILNLTRAVKHYVDTCGEVTILPLVVPVAANITHSVFRSDDSAPPKRSRVVVQTPTIPAFASFRIPQSFV